jgi:hypothetical protein
VQEGVSQAKRPENGLNGVIIILENRIIAFNTWRFLLLDCRSAGKGASREKKKHWVKA